VRFPGTICGWYAKTSRLVASTRTFSKCTSLVPFAALSPNVSTRVKFSIAQGAEELVIAVGLAVGFNKRLRVA